MSNILREKIFIGVGVIATLAVAFMFFHGRNISIDDSAALAKKVPAKNTRLPQANAVPQNAPGTLVHSPFTGIDCRGEALSRPIAVMLSGDTVARPLSGLSSADIVLEMPVITSSVTRLMAVFTCAPTLGLEVGSIRSSRDDYIPIVAGLDAIYAHWGGSHFALDKLNNHIIDNLDALKNPGGAFFRKKGVAPHNGFSTLARLREAAAKLGYRSTANPGIEYLHENNISQGTINKISIGYLGQFRVEWRFDANRHAFLRFRGGTPEIDRTNRAQITASTIVVMRTNARQIEGQYNDVRVIGSGGVSVYRNGGVVNGRWEKAASPLNAPLRFLDAEGKEIPFAPGPIWLEIVQQDTIVTATQ